VAAQKTKPVDQCYFYSKPLSYRGDRNKAMRYSMLLLSAIAAQPVMGQQPRDVVPVTTENARMRLLEARVEAQDAVIRSLIEQVKALSVERSATPLPAPVAAMQTLPSAGVVASRLMETTTADGVTARLKGRLQIDALLVDAGDGATPTGTQLRRIQPLCGGGCLCGQAGGP
jgi:hypothetical protein